MYDDTQVKRLIGFYEELLTKDPHRRRIEVYFNGSWITASGGPNVMSNLDNYRIVEG